MLTRIGSDSAGTDRVLVLGDFNSDEANLAFRALLADPKARLRDSFRALHPRAKIVGTFNAFRGDSTAGKIDAVLVGPGWEVLGAGIDRRQWSGLWASDHFAVWAVIARK